MPGQEVFYAECCSHWCQRLHRGRAAAASLHPSGTGRDLCYLGAERRQKDIGYFPLPPGPVRSGAGEGGCRGRGREGRSGLHRATPPGSHGRGADPAPSGEAGRRPLGRLPVAGCRNLWHLVCEPYESRPSGRGGVRPAGDPAGSDCRRQAGGKSRVLSNQRHPGVGAAPATRARRDRHHHIRQQVRGVRCRA